MVYFLQVHILKILLLSLLKVKNKMSRLCTKDGAAVALAQLPTLPQESGVVLFMSPVSVS